jgi:hypothetical protein
VADTTDEITYTRNYDPFGMVTQAGGSSQGRILLSEQVEKHTCSIKKIFRACQIVTHDGYWLPPNSQHISTQTPFLPSVLQGLGLGSHLLADPV